MKPPKRIGILTGGGDCPGLNAVIRAVVIRLSDCVVWPKEEFDRIWKTRSSYPKFETIAFLCSSVVLIMAYQVFSSMQDVFFPEFLRLLLLGLIAMIVLTAVYSMITYYKEKKALTEIIGSLAEDSKVTYRDTIDDLFATFNFEPKILE